MLALYLVPPKTKEVFVYVFLDNLFSLLEGGFCGPVFPPEGRAQTYLGTLYLLILSRSVCKLICTTIFFFNRLELTKNKVIVKTGR